MEIAVCATDLAESLGSAVALNLLFHIPILWAIVITAFDVLLLLSLQGMGMRMIEAVVAVFVLTIGVCYAIEIFIFPQTQPVFSEMAGALVRSGSATGRHAGDRGRHDWRDGDAAQPLPAFGAGAIAQGRTR